MGETRHPRASTWLASLNNLGVVAFNRGDLATAEELHRRVLPIREKLAPGSLDVAATP